MMSQIVGTVGLWSDLASCWTSQSLCVLRAFMTGWSESQSVRSSLIGCPVLEAICCMFGMAAAKDAMKAASLVSLA